MKCIFTLIISVAMALNAVATDYNKLWQQVGEAQQQDLPRKAITLLKQIGKTATREHRYGELIAAELLETQLISDIAPDSLPPRIKQLEQKADAAEQKGNNGDDEQLVVSAIYNTVLAKACNDSARFSRALQHPDVLARHTTEAYQLLIAEGKDDEVWQHDMLSIIGHEANRHQLLYDYYLQHGNRRAACLELCMLADGINSDNDEHSLTHKRQLLQQAMHDFSDLSEAGYAARLYYSTIRDDGDIADATRYAFLSDAISRWGGTPNGNSGNATYGNTLINLRSQLVQPQFIVKAGSDILLQQARNVGTLQLDFMPLNADGRLDLSVNREKEMQQLLRLVRANETVTITRDYSRKEPWLLFSDTIAMPTLAPGVYLVKATSGEITAYTLFYHSDLALLTTPLGKTKTRLITVSATTGRPVPNATVMLTPAYGNTKDAVTTTYHTDLSGELVIDADRFRHKVYAYTDHDNAFRERIINSSWSVYDSKMTLDNIQVYLDRTIYQPGQQVQGNIICFNSGDYDNIHVVEGKTVKFSVYDTEGNKIHTDSVTTDANGHAPFAFTLPRDSRNGRFRIQASGNERESAHRYFTVEEYKRPTFEILRPELNTTYHAGDTAIVTFKAMTFTQLPVQGATVTYSIERSQDICWGRYYRGSIHWGTRFLARNQKAVTDKDGTVSIPVPVCLPEEAYGMFRFRVSVKITDATGETHEDSYTVNAESTTRLPRLASDDPKKQDFELSSDVFPRDTQAVTLTLNNLNSKQTGSNSKQDDSNSKQADSKRGASTVIYYTVLAGTDVIESRSLETRDTVFTRVFKYKKEYGEALTISYAWVKDNKLHALQQTIRKPQPDLRLKTAWQTFRDHTQPGSHEEWKLLITRADGKPAGTSVLMATMYDRSLDKLASMSWTLRVLRNNYSLHNSWNYSGYHSSSLSGWGDTSTLAEKRLRVGSLISDIIPYSLQHFARSGFGRDRLGYASEPMLMAKAASVETATEASASDNTIFDCVEAPASASKRNVAIGYFNVNGADNNGNNTDEGTEAPADLSSLVRSGLSETAFFMPTVVADNNGIATLSFQLPETMTSWRFRALIHDRQMRNTSLDTTCVAQKSIIVKPNVPRFLRQGDMPVFEATVSNTTDRDINADVIMQLLTPGTEEVVWQRKTTSLIPATGSSAITMSAPLVTTDSLLIYRIVAQQSASSSSKGSREGLSSPFKGNREGLSVSDGEQHYIPVLPATEIITRTIALTEYISSPFKGDREGPSSPFKGEREGLREGLIDSLMIEGSTKRKVEVKVVDNPALLVVDALPRLMSPNDRCAICQAAALYACQLVKGIASNEGLKALREGIDTIIPHTDSIAEQVTKHLAELQQADGSWSWWPGMEGSRYITTHVARLFARLQYLGFASPETDDMLAQALTFLDEKAAEELTELKKWKKKYPKETFHPSSAGTDYLYICAITGRNNAAQKGLLAFLEKVSTEYDIADKAQSAVIFALNGNRKKALQHLESLKQYSVSTPEAGTYYDTRRAAYSWRNYRIPTQVAAIEAMRIVTPDATLTLCDMQRWLLHEKRTQQWDNTANTADAIYAFLDLPRPSLKDGHEGPSSPFKGDREGLNMRWVSIFVEQEVPLKDIPESQMGFAITREVSGTDKVSVKITIDSERDYDFVEVTDRRPACLEMVQPHSGYRFSPAQWNSDWAGYYEDIHNDHTSYYFNQMSKGRHIIESEYYVDRKGTYQSGSCTVRCAYAPEFSGNTEIMTIKN